MNPLGSQLASMLKLGTIGFGGGSAMIPVFEKELVQNRAVLEEDVFIRHTVISNVTPGGLPTKLAALSGFHVAGTRGAVLSSIAAGLPGTVMAVAIIGFFGVLGQDALRWVEYAAVGISAFIILLLVEYIAKVWRTAGPGRPLAIGITLVTFVVSGLNQFVRVVGLLLGQDWSPSLPSMNAIQVIGVSLVLIAGTIALRRPTPLPLAPGKPDPARMRRYLRAGALFSAIAVAAIGLSALVAGVGGGTLMALIALSMLATFGGGPAYIAVADAFFVGTYVSAEVFYSQLVPVGNATPGPLITKLAAEVAYTYGLENVSVAVALVLATCGLVVAATVSGAVAMVVMGGYERVAGRGYMRRLQQYVVPVICGLLITTALSMTLAAVAIGGRAGVEPTPMAWAMVALVGALLAVHPRVRLPDVAWIGAAGALTLVVLGFLVS